MNIVKILLLTVVVLLLLVVSAISIFLVTFDANQYKQDLSILVKQQTQRDLSFQGDIGLTLYPSLGMKLGSMSFSNAKGFGNEPMLAVNRASVSVDVLSLLSFNPQIAELVLDGLNVNLQTNKQGITNWDDLIPDAGDKQAVTGDEAAVRVESEVDLQGAFGGLAITDAKLLWSDAQAGIEYQVNIVSLLTGKIQPEQPFPLQLEMAAKSVNEFTSTVLLKSDVLLGERKLSLTALSLETLIQGELIPVDKLKLNVNGDVDFSTSDKRLSLSGFNTTVVTTGGVLESSNTVLTGEIGFDLNQQQLTIAVLDIQSTLQGTSVPNGKVNASVSASKLDLQLNKRAVVLDDLVLALNENQFKGTINVQDYAQPAVKFDLQAKRFDVDKLIGNSDKAEQVEQAETATDEDVQIQLPMELLRSLKLDGKLGVGTLMAQGLTVNDVLLKVDANKGMVNIKPLKMALYDGKFSGAIQVDARAEKPVYKVQQKLSSFQIGKFLQDFMGDDTVSGNANLDVDITTRGEWLSKLKSNLNGDLNVLIKDGALKGFNLRHKIKTAKAKLKRTKAPELKEKKTDFSALSLSALIVDGVLTTDDLDMQAPLIRVGGKGSADIAQETVDYLVNAKLVTTSKGQQGGSADDLSGVLIPVAITGSWLSPKIDVQYDEMLKAKLKAQKAKIAEDVAKQKAELKQKLDIEKAKLKASQQKATEAKKQQLEKQRQLVEAEQKEKLEAEKKRKQAELDARKKAEKEKAKKKLQDKLKKLF